VPSWKTGETALTAKADSEALANWRKSANSANSASLKNWGNWQSVKSEHLS